MQYIILMSLYVRLIEDKMLFEVNIFSRTWAILTHFILETPKGVLAKRADPDQMPHNVASDLGLHYFASCSTIFQQKYLNIARHPLN